MSEASIGCPECQRINEPAAVATRTIEPALGERPARPEKMCRSLHVGGRDEAGEGKTNSSCKHQ